MSAPAVVVALLIAATPTKPAPQHRWVAYGSRDRWIAFDVLSHKATVIKMPDGLIATDLAISEDAELVAAVATRRQDPRQARLYLCNRSTARVLTLSSVASGAAGARRAGPAGAWRAE